MKSYTVYLIRHGMTDEGGEGRYIGHTDVPLSEEGRQQLIRLKDELVYPPSAPYSQARSQDAQRPRQSFTPRIRRSPSTG